MANVVILPPMVILIADAPIIVVGIAFGEIHAAFGRAIAFGRVDPVTRGGGRGIVL